MPIIKNEIIEATAEEKVALATAIQTRITLIKDDIANS